MGSDHVPTGPSSHQHPPPNHHSPPSKDMLASRPPAPTDHIHPHSRPPPLDHYVPPPIHHPRPPTGWLSQDPRTRPRMFGPESSTPLGMDPRSSSGVQPSRLPPQDPRDALPMSRNYSDESQRSGLSNASAHSHLSTDHDFYGTQASSASHTSGSGSRGRIHQADAQGTAARARHDVQSEPVSRSRSPPRQRRTRVLMTKMQWHALMSLWEQTIFPATNEREALAHEIGLTPRQVQVWFQNQRQKQRREREIDEANAATAAGSGNMPRTAEAPPNWASALHGAGAATAEAVPNWAPSVSGASNWSARSAPAHLQSAGENATYRLRALTASHPVRGRPPIGEAPVPPMSNVAHSPHEPYPYPQHPLAPSHDAKQYVPGQSRPPPVHDQPSPHYSNPHHHPQLVPTNPHLPPPPPPHSHPYSSHPQPFQPPEPHPLQEAPPHGHPFQALERRTTGPAPYHAPSERRTSSSARESDWVHQSRDAWAPQSGRPRSEEGPGPTRPRSRSVAISNRPYPPPHQPFRGGPRPPDIVEEAHHRPMLHRQHSVPDTFTAEPQSLSPSAAYPRDVRPHDPAGRPFYRPASPPPPGTGMPRQDTSGSRQSSMTDAHHGGRFPPPPSRTGSDLPPSLSSLVLDRPVDQDRPAPPPLSPLDSHSMKSLARADHESGPTIARRSSEGTRGSQASEAQKKSPGLPSLAKLLN